MLLTCLLMAQAYASDYRDLGKIEITQADGRRTFVQAKVVSRAYDVHNNSYNLQYPTVEVDGATYPFAATGAVKEALCAISNDSRASDQFDSAAITALEYAQPGRAVDRTDAGFVWRENVTSVAGVIPCVTGGRDTDSYRTALTKIDIVSKGTERSVEGELRVASFSKNFGGTPVDMIAPKVFIDSRAYELYADHASRAMNVALCGLVDSARTNTGVASRPTGQKMPVIVFKDEKFWLYDSVAAPSVVSSMTCGGAAGGDGSR